MPASIRILLCVTGLSPQVVTETCFALVKQTPAPWIPTEIHVITTKAGADNARLNLLSEAKGWFHRLSVDYQLPPIRFDVHNIHVIKDRLGVALSDIRSQSDNEDAADFICQIVRDLTANTDSELHVSIAGGRKTMGYYLGYALSLLVASKTDSLMYWCLPRLKTVLSSTIPRPTKCPSIPSRVKKR